MTAEFFDVQLDVTFTAPNVVENIASQDNISAAFGKISKWYTSFAWSAWTAPTVEVTGSGNAVTSATYGTGANENKLILTLGTTFLTQHPTIPVTTDTTSTSAPSFGGTFTAVDSVSRDANGHVTTLNTKTVTIPNTTMGAATSSAAGTIGLVPAPAAGEQASFLRGDGTWAIPISSPYTAGTGLVLSGLTFNHSNSVTERTDYMQPYVKYDAQGHITGSSYWMATAAGTGGTAGWVKVATIKHKMHYDNTPFLLDVSQRGNTISYRIHIRWENLDDTDPPLGEFLIASDHAWESISPSAYIIKSDTSTWDLYIKKLDNYEAIAMKLQPGLYFRDHTEWTWQDEQTAESAITGGTEATKKIYSTTDHTHDSLISKTLTTATLDGTAGNFFFKGDSLLGGINDWVGIQADAGNDKFQLIAYANNLLFRQNDTGGTNTTNWQAWNFLMTPSCVTGENGITATIHESTIGSGDSATPFNQGVVIGHSNSVTPVTTASLLKFTYDAQGHITGSTAVAKADIPGLSDYLPLSGGTIANSAFAPLTIQRSNTANGAGIQFVNSNGTLGYIGMAGNANTGLKRWGANKIDLYTVCDTGNMNEIIPSTKYAFVVDESSDFASYAWHKFAEITISDAYADAAITFLVSRTWGNVDHSSGILTAHVRTSSTKVYESGQFGWLVMGTKQMDPTEFVMVYTNTASTSCKVELWHKQTSRYDGWVFKVLKEHSRSAYGNNPWTLFIHTGHGSASYTAGTGTIVSTVNTIANTSVSANKINTDAGDYQTPVYFSNGVPVAVNTAASGANFGIVPQVRTGDGVMEIGKYIDFHATNTSTNDYDVRVLADNENVITQTSKGGSTTFRISGTLPMLRFKQTTSGKEFDNGWCGIWCQPASVNGANMFMQSGGNLMIGSGEFAYNAYARKDSTGTTQVGYDNIVNSTTESLYLGSDNGVQIITNGNNIATYSDNNHKVWKFQTDGTLLTPGAITDALSAQHTMIQQNVRSDSNATTVVEWIVNGAASTTYKPGITFYNIGGDSTDKGAIILRPYHHNNAAWGTDVGLYIGKGILKLDGTNVSLEGHTHETLTCKSVDATTVNNTAGCFFFKGANLLGNVYDWVGIQADAGNDKFQLIPNGGGSLMYRHNDAGGTNSNSWSTWNGILTPSSVATDSYLSMTATTTTIGTGDSAFTYNSGIKISHKAYTSKASGLYKITVDAAGHVSATASVVKGDIPALDYVPNTNAGVNAAINLLTTGNSVPVDNDYYISQYVNGGTSTTTYHRRPVSALYSYIEDKLQHNAGLNMAHLFSGWNTVGWHRVLSFPCSASASGRIVRTIELTCIRNYNNGQPEVFSVRMIGLYNATEGFEILYSKSNTAATQYIPKIRMTKSSDGKTLYVDFYYNTTANNAMTVYCTWLDPDITNKGTYSITWGNGAVVDDSLAVVASLDIPRDITAPGTGFYYVIGTQTASTAAWTGKIPASKLHNGLTIAYYLPYASAASTNVTLNLTLSTGATTGAINVYYTGASRMTTHYGAGSTIILTYFEAGAISVSGTATTDARWTHSDYNTNTNTYVTQSNTTTPNYRALMMGYNNSTTPSDLTATVTHQVYASANLYAQPSTGLIACNGRKLIAPFAIQTASSIKRQTITLQVLMTWLITTKQYIHSGIYEHVVLQTTWKYADNDILRLTINGVNYEMDLAGVRIEYIGKATSYNAGEFTLKIISNPVPSFTSSSGWQKFPPATIAVYTCNGSQYNPVWRMIMNGACGQPKIFESTDNLSVLPMPIEVTGLFTNWKVLLAQCTRLIYGGGDECSSFQVIIPLEYLKSLGTSGEMHIPLPFTIDNNPIGRNYMILKYVNDNKFTIGYHNDGVDSIGGRGLWTMYGMY